MIVDKEQTEDLQVDHQNLEITLQKEKTAQTIWIKKIRKKLDIYKFDEKEKKDRKEKENEEEKANEKMRDREKDDKETEKAKETKRIQDPKSRKIMPETLSETLPETLTETTTTNSGIQPIGDENVISGANRKTINISKQSKFIGITRKGVFLNFKDRSKMTNMVKEKVVGGGRNNLLTHIRGQFVGDGSTENIGQIEPLDKLKNKGS